MKKRMIAGLILAQSLFSGHAAATGIPVVDVAHIAESVLQYQQQLRDYQEYMIQTGLQDSQLLQMVEDYRQVLREYNHYLNQISGLENALSGGDWDYLISIVQRNYGSADFGLLATMDADSATYSDDMRSVLGNYGMAPRTTTNVADDLAAAGVADTASYEQDMDQVNRVYSKYSNQQEMVSRNEVELGKLEQDRAANKLMLESLGDESDLATMQLIAAQQQLLSNQVQVQSTIANQQLQSYEPNSVLYANQRAARIEREAARLTYVQSRTNTEAGYSNYSDLDL
ncbi:type IV secretion system protein [Methylophaga nitratireducenticrescens]|uniref:type IV secretion system protein n=1 Tax=Methylophaga nitratireducenticrescens TaxID=754476 RepID=UPI000CDC6B69|nr:type IV secretion system protein [Methylophaga nitratireducenticrescens]AUZ86191.1 hypothetical protein CDW43_16180 [Methylophaga nitratireducenticrescens]